MGRLEELYSKGQSVWLDFIKRSYLEQGKLEALIENGLKGVTSNPTIFDKAISDSDDYDTAIEEFVKENYHVEKIYDKIVIHDIKMAADQLRKVYDATDGKDGFVSLEVSPELAHDTDKTVEAAKRYFSKVQRPNLMIKVPATAAGLPAIEKIIAAGINVNVTLIFDRLNYRGVMEAYCTGLEELAENGPSVPGGHPVNKVASVASFFVSRIDTAIDRELKEKGNTELPGKIAVANAKAAYRDFQDFLKGGRWEKLAGHSARVQRPLWASTGTKNPDYSDTLYIDELIGPDTVNTLPPATLDSFLDHGTISSSLEKDLDIAEKQLLNLNELGIDLSKITKKLQEDGVDSFVQSFRSLLKSIEDKKTALSRR